MDINKIPLPSSLIASLYRNSLIEFGKEAEPAPAEILRLQSPDPPGSNWILLGENQKKILIVVDHTSTLHLPDDELHFLTTMLTACSLSLADVAIVNRNNYKEIQYKLILSNFKSRIVFLFGTDPVVFGLPVSFPHFQVQSFAQATFLYTPALETIRTDGVLKSKLWVCLRRIFAI